MSPLQVVATGKLAKATEQRTFGDDGKLAMATLRVTVPVKGDKPATVWYRLIAFGRVAENLLRYRQGDTVTAVGPVSVARWMKGGAEVEAQQITATQIMGGR